MKTILVAIGAGILLSPCSWSAQIEVDVGRSRIQVDAKATGHAFTGSLEKYEVKVAGDPATGKPTALDLKWDFNDLDTADDKRDKEMVKWLGGGKPKGSFSFVKSWDETADGGKAQGNLTINGVSKAVSFPYTVKREGGWVTIDGKARLDYQDFKLPIIRAMAVMTVDPKLDVRFHIVGKVK
ncbi:MAG: YceI family protein [Verrucomicrobiaceae bacterium]|nr:MAG: YceI family protein [Verrucomicrobiaceae bacterium]